MKNFITLFLLLLSSSFLFSQSSTFSIEGKLHYLSQYDYNRQLEGNFASYTILPDSTYIYTTFTSSNGFKNMYKPKFGYEINGLVNFNVTKKITIKTGIGLNLTSFNITNEYIDDFRPGEIISIDTIAGAPPIFTGSSPCDTYTNTYTDAGETKEGTDYRILNLNIPLTVEYMIKDDKIWVGGGLYLQTPIYSSQYREYITIHMEEVEDEVFCEYRKLESNIKNGNNLENLRVGITASLSTQLSDRWSATLGMSKDLKNIFIKQYTVSLSGETSKVAFDKYKPLRLSIGFAYRLGKIEKL